MVISAAEPLVGPSPGSTPAPVASGAITAVLPQSVAPGLGPPTVQPGNHHQPPTRGVINPVPGGLLAPL